MHPTPSKPSELASDAMDVTSNVFQYRKQYLNMYARIHAHNEQNVLHMFQVKMRRYCSATGLLQPHEVEDLFRLKMRAMEGESTTIECKRAEDILDAAYMTLVLNTHPPIRSRIFLRVIRHVCRSLDRAQRRRTVKLFREGMARLNKRHEKRAKARRIVLQIERLSN